MYQFWLTIPWIVANQLQWYFNQIKAFPFMEIFCKYRSFCSGFVGVNVCFHTGCNKTLVPAQRLLPMFLLLIYLKISSERCKPFCSELNGVFFLQSVQIPWPVPAPPIWPVFLLPVWLRWRTLVWRIRQHPVRRSPHEVCPWNLHQPLRVRSTQPMRRDL